MPNLYKIKEILDQRNIPEKEFCKAIGMSASGFKRILERNSTRLHTLELIAQTLNCPVSLFFKEIQPEKEKEKRILKPHIPLSAQAGSLCGFNDSVNETGCEMNAKIEAFGNYDFTIDVKGDSMQPEYRSGDVVACKRLEAGDSIHFGEIYVIDSMQGIVMKQVEKYRKDETKIRCVSLNEQYEPFLLPLEEIYGMSIVVGVMKPR